MDPRHPPTPVQLFVNSDGVMLADGAVWMSGICDNDDCSSSHWAVTSINN